MIKRSPLGKTIITDGNDEVTITSIIGSGGSCIVYEGIHKNGKAVIKEYYPESLSLSRKENSNELIIPPEKKEGFEFGKELFLNAYQNHRQYFSTLNGYWILPEPYETIYCNNTVYSISPYIAGETLSKLINFDNDQIIDLYEISLIMKQICNVIQEMHNTGALYLDLKPDNLYITKAKKREKYDIKFFDFSSLVEVQKIQDEDYQYCSFSKSWAAPEQLDIDKFGRYNKPELISYATDYYAIGEIFFYLLTGRQPDVSDLEKVSSENFKWKSESNQERHYSNEAIALISKIARKTLNTDAESRKSAFDIIENENKQLVHIDSKQGIEKIIYNWFDELGNITYNANDDTDAAFLDEKIAYGVSEVKDLVKESEKNILSQVVKLREQVSGVRNDIITNSGNNRFKYDYINSVSFFGREDEYNILINWCLKYDSNISWIGICGQAGSGKTRLAYELCKKMQSDYGWIVRTPCHAKLSSNDIFEDIKKDSVNNNWLVCFDYVKYEKEEIVRFVQKIISAFHCFNGNKIRILLIERDSNDLIFEDENSVTELQYNNDDRLDNNYNLQLFPFNNEDNKALVKDYVIKQNKEDLYTTESEIEILKTLEKIDPIYKRPLYAMFIADAWCNGENLTNWDRKDAFAWILNKENNRINNSIETRCEFSKKSEKFDTIRKVIDEIRFLSTYFGKIEFQKCYEIVNRNSLKSQSIINEKTLKMLLSDNGLLDDAQNVLLGIEPDLFGEYYCIDYIKKNESIINSQIEEIIETDFYAYISYTDKIFGDFELDILDSSWADYLRNVNFPSGIDYVKKNLFSRCTFLKNIYFHDRVFSIQAGAFRQAINLEKVILPASVEKIGNAAFRECTNLKSVFTEDGNGLTPSILEIGDGAFYECKSLTECLIPDSVYFIGKAAFEKCVSLKDIILPRKIKTISNAMFADCSSLESVKISAKSSHKDKIVIGADSFKNCSVLTKIIGLSEIAEINNSAFQNCRSLKEVYLSSNLVKLSQNAFSDCKGLCSVDLKDASITKIEERTFFGCESLVKIELPENIVSIGRKAFANCNKLEKVSIPASLKKIEAYAFCECSSLRDIKFPSHIQSIEEYAICGCDNILLDSFIDIEQINNKNISGFIFSKFSDIELMFIKQRNRNCIEYVLDTVTEICDNAFRSDEAICEINIPPSVRKIGNNAFSGCINLKKVTFDNSKVNSIGENIFVGCVNLEKIVGLLKISIIPNGAFSGCTKIESIEIENLKSIGERAFFNCSALKEIKSTKTIEDIGISAFYGCENLVLPIVDSTSRKQYCGFVFSSISWKEKAFLKNYWKYTKIILPKTCIGLYKNPFVNCNNVKTIIIPSSVQKLPDGVFEGCISLEEVGLPGRLKYIPPFSFARCKNLKRIIFGGYEYNFIPEHVIIGKAAFLGCCSIEKMRIANFHSNIPELLFLGCYSLKSFVVPDGVKNIGEAAFKNCVNLENITIPMSVSSIGEGAFCGCFSLEEVTGLSKSQIVDVENETFRDCRSLKKIDLPDTVTSIGPYSFFDCRAAINISVPRTISYIGVAAFQNCYKLDGTIRIPKGVKAINAHTFKHCSSITTVILPPTITEIANSAFYGCSSLQNIRIPSSVIRIGNAALSNCGALTECLLPETLQKLPDSLCENCYSLTKVVIPSNITDVSTNCFKRCKSIKSIILPKNVSRISSGAFRGCCQLETIENIDSESLKEILPSAFRYCDNLKSITLSNNLKCIDVSVFQGCKKLERIEFGKIVYVGNYAFADCSMLSIIPIENITERIGIAAFYNCKSLCAINFSNTIKTIDTSAFGNNISAKELSFPPSICRIAISSFRKMEALESVVFENEDTLEIRKSAFRECCKLKGISIVAENLVVFEKAFKDCSELYYFDYIPTNNRISHTAFDNCPAYDDVLNNSKTKWVIADDKPNDFEIRHKIVNCDDSNKFEVDYTSDGESVIIKRYIGKEEEIMIPPIIDSKAVVAIGDSAFEENYQIKAVVMPNSISRIGVDAFAYCKNLQSINLPDSVTYIGEYAFKDCHQLGKMKLSNNLTSIEKGTFMYCYSLKSVMFPSSVKNIKSKAFLACPLESIIIPNSNITIENGAFARCDKNNMTFNGTINDEWFV